jgi:hypothetical protein
VSALTDALDTWAFEFASRHGEPVTELRVGETIMAENEQELRAWCASEDVVLKNIEGVEL